MKIKFMKIKANSVPEGLKMKKDFFKFALVIIMSAFSFASCDSGNVESPPAFIEIIEGPANRQVLGEDQVKFMWKGADDSYQFKYRLLSLDKDNFPTDYIAWTGYSKTNEIVIKNLNEGNYKFEIMGISDGIEGGPITREFLVDAVRNSSLMFFKTETHVKSGQKDSVGIWMEDVDSLTAFKVVLAFDTSRIQLTAVHQGQLVKDMGLAQIILPNLGDPAILAKVNSTGKIEVSSAVLITPSSSLKPFLSGSGQILNLIFKGKKPGRTTLEFTTITLRKKDGREINYTQLRNAVIYVE